jgi:hypothetical protein
MIIQLTAVFFVLITRSSSLFLLFYFFLSFCEMEEIKSLIRNPWDIYKRAKEDRKYKHTKHATAWGRRNIPKGPFSTSYNTKPTAYIYPFIPWCIPFLSIVSRPRVLLVGSGPRHCHGIIGLAGLYMLTGRRRKKTKERKERISSQQAQK